MYEILVYLFENCHQNDLLQDADRVAKKLSAAGFEESDISEALNWIAGLVQTPQRDLSPLPDARRSFRVFSPAEIEKLDVASRGLLIGLESAGILTPQTRELAIERALAATDDCLSIEQMKLIVLMVLWNQHTPTSQLIAEELLSETIARTPS